jgi:hypothetical protein
MAQMTRKEAAIIMKQTSQQHKYWWMSSKNEKASKEFLKAREIYKQTK